MQNTLKFHRQTSCLDVFLYLITLGIIILIGFSHISFAQEVVIGQSFEGEASWYGPGFAGNLTANGEIYDPSQLTAAHKTLPFGTLLRITNLANGLTVDVRINDRGPYIGKRIIDLSQAAAAQIDMERAGVGTVRAEFISELGQPAFPATASHTLESNQSLNSIDVAHPDYPEGALLLAYSFQLAEPILLRAVDSQNIKNDSNTLLVSESLLAKAGNELQIYYEAVGSN